MRVPAMTRKPQGGAGDDLRIGRKSCTSFRNRAARPMRREMERGIATRQKIASGMAGAARAGARANGEPVRKTNAMDGVSHRTTRLIPAMRFLKWRCWLANPRHWWLGAESNRRPQHYECRALTV